MIKTDLVYMNLKTYRKELINQLEYLNINQIKERFNIFISFIDLNLKDISYIKHLKKLQSYKDLLNYYIKEINLRYNTNQINKDYLLGLKKDFYNIMTKTNNILICHDIQIIFKKFDITYSKNLFLKPNQRKKTNWNFEK